MAAVLHEYLRYFSSSCYEGVDHTIPGNGGIECYNFLTFNQRLADTCSYLMIIFLCLAPVAQRRLKFPKESLMNSGDDNSRRYQKTDRGKTLLLIALCITFGIELGYKLATKQLIYTLNPCHIITTMQVGRYQTVKFGLRGERVPRAKISGLFSACAKFFDSFLSAQNFQPVCCVTCAVFKKGLQILFLPRMEQFQYNPCTFALRVDG